MIYINGEQIGQNFTWWMRTEVSAPNTAPTFWQVDSTTFGGTLADALAITEPQSTQGFTNVTTLFLPAAWAIEDEDEALELKKIEQEAMKLKSDAMASGIVLPVYDFQGQIALKDYYPACTQIGKLAIDCAKAWIAKVYSVHTAITIKLDLGFYFDESELNSHYNALPPAPAKFQTIMNLGLGVQAKPSAMPTAEQQTLGYWQALLATLQ